MATVASTCELDFAIATRSEWPREYAKVLLLWRVEGRYIPIIRAGLALTGGQPFIMPLGCERFLKHLSDDGVTLAIIDVGQALKLPVVDGEDLVGSLFR